MEIKILIFMTITFLITICTAYFLYYKLAIEQEKKNKSTN